MVDQQSPAPPSTPDSEHDQYAAIVSKIEENKIVAARDLLERSNNLEATQVDELSAQIDERLTRAKKEFSRGEQLEAERKWQQATEAYERTREIVIDFPGLDEALKHARDAGPLVQAIQARMGRRAGGEEGQAQSVSSKQTLLAPFAGKTVGLVVLACCLVVAGFLFFNRQVFVHQQGQDLETEKAPALSATVKQAPRSVEVTTQPSKNTEGGGVTTSNKPQAEAGNGKKVEEVASTAADVSRKPVKIAEKHSTKPEADNPVQPLATAPPSDSQAKGINAAVDKDVVSSGVAGVPEGSRQPEAVTAQPAVEEHLIKTEEQVSSRHLDMEQAVVASGRAGESAPSPSAATQTDFSASDGEKQSAELASSKDTGKLGDLSAEAAEGQGESRGSKPVLASEETSVTQEEGSEPGSVAAKSELPLVARAELAETMVPVGEVETDTLHQPQESQPVSGAEEEKEIQGPKPPEKSQPQMSEAPPTSPIDREPIHSVEVKTKEEIPPEETTVQQGSPEETAVSEDKKNITSVPEEEISSKEHDSTGVKEEEAQKEVAVVSSPSQPVGAADTQVQGEEQPVRAQDTPREKQPLGEEAALQRQEKQGESYWPEGTRLYRVVQGDTLETIARKLYGDPFKWSIIANANNQILSTNPDKLSVGLQLVIPPLDSAQLAGTGSTTPGLSEDGTTYTVQSGDTLALIAKKLYGNSNSWWRIYRLNRELLPSPDQLKVGMILRLEKREDSSQSGLQPQPTSP